MYKGLNDDDPSLTQLLAVPHSEVLAVQGQSSPHGNKQDSYQIQGMNSPIFNWKAYLTCYKCREKKASSSRMST